MSHPIFRDPVFDGASDPVVIHDRAAGCWRMFYTQRRATVDEPGVAWVHGSRIGRATSLDGGVTWHYDGVVEGFDPPLAPDSSATNTQWAPEIVDDGTCYHAFVTWIAGVPESWFGHPRRIVHFVSDDLVTWTGGREMTLASDRVIDAAVARLPDGRFGLWYKDEAAESITPVSFSDDLQTWRAGGIAVDGEPHEGPNVFELGGWWWMLVDAWRGLRVLRSADGLDWHEAGTILDAPGGHPEDRQIGRHADVVAGGGDEAIVFYFTHPDWDGRDLAAAETEPARRTAVHRARLTVVDGALVCDRDAPLTPLDVPPTLGAS